MAADDILTRQAPHSPEAERAVLGSLLIDARCAPGVVGVLKSSDFYSPLNRAIYDTIYSMFSYSKTIDPVTVLDNMKTGGVWTDSAPTYVLELMNLTPTSANVLEYAAIVRDMSLMRSIADAGSAITEMAVSGEGGAENVLDAAEKKVYALRQDRTTSGLEPIGKILAGVYEQISYAALNGSGLPGVSSGFSDLDSRMMGLNNSDLIIIASRPGMGKTSIALNIALHAARESKKAVAFFSLEMSREQLALRLLSSESRIDGKKLQTGRVSSEEWKRLAEAASSISKTEILIDDNASLSVADMNAQCRRVRNLGLVVIDYLQLMQSASNSSKRSYENRVQVVSDISRMMKIMAKELNVPVLCGCQLSRANEARANKRPMLSDLRESGSIEQDADIVLGLYRDDYYDKNTVNPNIAECIILKNRRGETGSVDLLFQPEFTTYTSLDRRHEDGYGEE
ncbi:MAG: replicative DNA helicase [Oscillospiraceae bacterium]|jgi:replicative DNA helicase|nr:replicative DNA helicase [Oscillospiraceae bacterium]